MFFWKWLVLGENLILGATTNWKILPPNNKRVSTFKNDHLIKHVYRRETRKIFKNTFSL